MPRARTTGKYGINTPLTPYTHSSSQTTPVCRCRRCCKWMSSTTCSSAATP
nr:MAG TPA: hypothetical protein [Bacteriophage sp.]